MLRRLFVLCLLALAACQCGKKDFSENLNLRVPPVPNGESCVYRVRVESDSVGLFETLVVQDWIREAPAFALMSVLRVADGEVETIDSALVFVSRARLQPLSSFRFIRAGEALVTTGVNYGEGEVAVAAYSSAAGEKQQLLANDRLTFDTDQLVFLGRALRLDPKRPTSVKVVNPMGPPFGGAVHAARFRAGGDEMVTVPAGSFDCRRVFLTVEESEVALWYEKAGTGRLVRYEAPDAGLAMELLPPGPGEPAPESTPLP